MAKDIIERKIGYLGIDESNHGRFPEVFVALYSEIPYDIIRQEKIIGKKRNLLSNFKPLLNQRTFSHIVIEKNFYGMFEEDIKLFVFSELIKAYGNLEMVVIDGEMRDFTLDKLKLSIPSCPDFIVEAKADQHYPIVHLADRVAYNLYRYYSRSKDMSQREKYAGHVLKLEMTPI